MKARANLSKLFLAALAGIFLFAVDVYTVAADPNGFMDGFDDAVLDPAWQIVEFAGTQDQTNHFSLTDNPGRLRYRLDPMTHSDGFVNDFQITSDQRAPGMELRRAIGGEEWLLEAKVRYYLSYTTGRGFALDVYFGDGDIGTFAVQFLRQRSTYQNSLRVILTQTIEENPLDTIQLASSEKRYGVSSGPNMSTFYFKLERSGSILTAMWSEDDENWNEAFCQDMGALLDGLEQTVVISGLSYRNTGGAYADYDYIDVIAAETALNVDVDIKPGNDSNTINPNSKGVIPVAILSSEDFDATDIDPLSVTFGLNEAMETHGKGHIEDMNEDGFDDLLLHFRTQETGIASTDTEACLTGETLCGLTFTGCDEIQISGKQNGN